MTPLEITVGAVTVAAPLIAALSWIVKMDGRVKSQEQWRTEHLEEHKEFREEYRADQQITRQQLNAILTKFKQ